MIEYIPRGEDVIDRAVFMADTAARFMAHNPDMNAKDAFRKADSLWQVMIEEFGGQTMQSAREGEGGGEDEGEGNVIRLHGS